MNTPLPFPRPVVLLLLGLALAGSASAQGQWQWRDANGNRVFSDTAPPPGVTDQQILKRPVGASGPAAPAPAAAAPAAKPAAPAAGRDPELEAKAKAQAKTPPDPKQQAEEARIAKVKAENCERARQHKAMLDTGVRIARPNAKGEREFLDEKGIQEERQRTQQSISENCTQ